MTCSQKTPSLWFIKFNRLQEKVLQDWLQLVQSLKKNNSKKYDCRCLLHEEAQHFLQFVRFKENKSAVILFYFRNEGAKNQPRKLVESFGCPQAPFFDLYSKSKQAYYSSMFSTYTSKKKRRGERYKKKWSLFAMI